jgi:hypothetical protein
MISALSTRQYFTNEIKELRKKIKWSTDLGYPSLQDEMNLQEMIDEYNSVYKKSMKGSR